MTKVNRAYRALIPLTDRTLAALDRMANATGATRASVASKFLDDMAEQIDFLAGIVEEGKRDPAAARAKVDAFADSAKAELARVQAEHADELEEPRKAKRQRSARAASSPRSSGRRFRVEDLATGERWQGELTWTDDAADRALASAQKANPGRNWVLREV